MLFSQMTPHGMMLPTVMAMAKVLSNNEMKKCQISPFRSSSRSGGINPGALFPDTFVTPEDGIGQGEGRGEGADLQKVCK